METESRSQRIAVTGATGRVGSHLVEILEQRGHDVVPISRSTGVDVITGEGLDEALTAVETIIDLATGPSPDQESATEFFTTSARNLQRAGAAAGARGIVVVSIIVAHVPEMQTQLVAARIVAETLADAAEEPEIENGRITEVAGPRAERLADVAAALFASRGDSTEIREARASVLVPAGDPDAEAYAEGAVLPNPGAKLAGPSFEEWLAAA
jgi:uncharacterized protein YbjT (DUF2867 family)